VAPPFLLRDGAPALPEALPAYVMTLDFDGERVVGEGRFTFTNPTSAPLADLTFLLHGNDGPRASTSLTRVSVPGRTHTQDADVRQLVLHLDPPLAPGEAGTVELGWVVTLEPLADDVNDVFAQGLAALSGPSSSFGLQATGDGIAVVASGFPTFAPFVGGAPAPRMIRPDVPIGDLAWNGPARWDVTVRVPAGLTVVTNLADTVSDGVVHAQGEGPWDFVFVALDDAVVLEHDVGGVRVRSFARRRDAAAGRQVLEDGVRALRFLERYGRYPYRELDLVEASLTGGAGGVEFGGLALVAGFLYRELPPSPLAAMLGDLPTGNLGEMRSFVVAHEVAHQWSPGLLVSDAWASPVVDEALAQYLAWRVLSGGRAPADADALFDRQVTVGYATMRLFGKDDGVAARETTAFADPIAYGGLVYGKAPHLYRHLERAVGVAALDGAIRETIASRAWTVVTPADWLAALDSHGAPGATALGQRWWYGATGDLDLGLDPEGRAALRLVLGPSAPQLEAMLGQLGMTPAAWFEAFGAAMGPKR
jgi:hypothetical protein